MLAIIDMAPAVISSIEVTMPNGLRSRKPKCKKGLVREPNIAE